MPKCEECKYSESCKKPYDCSIEVQYQVLGRVVTKEEWEREECIGFEPTNDIT